MTSVPAGTAGSASSAGPLAPRNLPDDNTLVIGEGVVLDLQPASFATRMLSAMIDYGVLSVLLIAVSFVIAGILSALDSAAAGAFFLVTWIAIIVGLPTLVETVSRGKSLGRLALGLRVVRDDGGAIRLRHAIIRAMLSVFEIWLMVGAPAVICSLANAKGKRVGDLLAGTYVVRERGYRPPPLYLRMPGYLQPWASGADILRLPDDLAMAVRQFLTRAHLMAPQPRAALGSQLADEVRQLVAPAPPAGTSAEDFLHAVLSARRDRELARLQREREAAARREHAMHRLPYSRG
ncbi:MAG: RDD family protein [Actinomycetales bacterium]